MMFDECLKDGGHRWGEPELWDDALIALASEHA